MMTPSALAISGVIVGIIIPKDKKMVDDDGKSLYLGSIALNYFLCGPFSLIVRFKEQIRIITCYLIATGQSKWEQDWKMYRDRYGHIGYAEPGKYVFVAQSFSVRYCHFSQSHD